jgi:hypothetical protein
VLVLDLPVPVPGDGFRAALRRVVPSPSFRTEFAESRWPAEVTPDDAFGAMVPLGSRRASGKRRLELTDDNGVRHECVAEAFKARQVFILIHVAMPLTAVSVRVA